jgi:glycosyltransferase involved in cell wall biosynthesis
VLFSKFFRKKSIVIVRGYDVACEPEINYGICMKNKLRRWMSKFALNNADFLLPVSNNTKTECFKHLTHPRDLSVLYLGVNTEKFKLGEKKKELVMTVATGFGRNIIKLKGLDTICQCRSISPRSKF